MTTEQTLFERLMAEAQNIDHTRVADLLIEAARALQSAELAAYAGQVGQMRLAAELDAAQAAAVPSNGWPDTDAERAAPVAPAEPTEWTDARLRGIASDYFQDATHWSAAMLCLRHMLMEQAKATAPVAPALVPLSDEQIEYLAATVARDDMVHDFARAIEAAHGIKP